MATLRIVTERLGDEEGAIPVVVEVVEKAFSVEQLMTELGKFIGEAWFEAVEETRLVFHTISFDRRIYTFTVETADEMSLLHKALLHYLLVEKQRGRTMSDQIHGVLAAIASTPEFKSGEVRARQGSEMLPLHLFCTSREFGQFSGGQLFAACAVMAAGYKLAASDIRALTPEQMLEAALAGDPSTLEERLLVALG